MRVIQEIEEASENCHWKNYVGYHSTHDERNVLKLHRARLGKIMKRDLDLIRTILLRLESIDVPAGHCIPVGPNDLETEGYSGEQVAYHIQLLKSGGFVRELGSKPSRYGLNYSGLSWEGHEFLDSVRDEKVWRDTRNAVQTIGGFTFGMVTDVAKEILSAKIKSAIGLAV